MCEPCLSTLKWFVCHARRYTSALLFYTVSHCRMYCSMYFGQYSTDQCKILQSVERLHLIQLNGFKIFTKFPTHVVTCAVQHAFKTIKKNSIQTKTKNKMERLQNKTNQNKNTGTKLKQILKLSLKLNKRWLRQTQIHVLLVTMFKLIKRSKQFEIAADLGCSCTDEMCQGSANIRHSRNDKCNPVTVHGTHVLLSQCMSCCQ